MAVTNPLEAAEKALLEQLHAAEKQVSDLQEMINGIRKLQKREPIVVQKDVVKAPNTDKVGRRRRSSGPKKDKKPKKTFYPTQYSEAKKTYQIVYVALHNLKSGTLHDVMKELKRLDKKKFSDPKYLRKFAQNGLHHLLNFHKKIKANLQGLSYIYSI